jgi:molybdate transport system ATP-binding protein
MGHMAGELIFDCRKRLAGGFELNAELRIPLDRAPVTVLFGPSGAGKSTLLRLLAGLERPDSGVIAFRDRVWCDVAANRFAPPQQRRASLLFQESALFPHLTVAGNIAFAATPAKAAALMQRFALTELADRLPHSLSGGQQQRVALARALAAEPALLLLDEPLSALDAAQRTRMRQELRSILHAAAVPSILVTHDRTEAIALADWMAVIVDGRIRQSGPVQEVFRRPADPDVAESVGVENVVPAQVVARTGGLATVLVGAVPLECVDSGASGAVLACVRAEEVAITRDTAKSSARNRIPGRVHSITMEGPLARVDLDCGFPLVATVTAQSAREMNLNPGDPVTAVVKATAVHLIPVADHGEKGIG